MIMYFRKIIRSNLESCFYSKSAVMIVSTQDIVETYQFLESRSLGSDAPKTKKKRKIVNLCASVLLLEFVLVRDF